MSKRRPEYEEEPSKRHADGAIEIQLLCTNDTHSKFDPIERFTGTNPYRLPARSDTCCSKVGDDSLAQVSCDGISFARAGALWDERAKRTATKPTTNNS